MPLMRMQPIVATESGRSVAFELLAGEVSVPPWSAQDWLLWYAGMHEWMDDVLKNTEVPVFVNLNSEQAVTPRIVAYVNALIGRYGARIGIEWTEDLCSCEVYQAAVAQFRRWSAEGVALSVDDVGDGHDGIGRCLAVLPKYAKFSTRLMQAERHGALSILSHARRMFEGLGCEVVIEGVENQADLSIVKRAGLQYAQGYVFGRPQPLSPGSVDRSLLALGAA